MMNILIKYKKSKHKNQREVANKLHIPLLLPTNPLPPQLSLKDYNKDFEKKDITWELLIRIYN